jgi:hypothetical protein
LQPAEACESSLEGNRELPTKTANRRARHGPQTGRPHARKQPDVLGGSWVTVADGAEGRVPDAFAWRTWGKPRANSVRTADVTTSIQMRHFSNTRQNCWRLMQLCP